MFSLPPGSVFIVGLSEKHIQIGTAFVSCGGRGGALGARAPPFQNQAMLINTMTIILVWFSIAFGVSRKSGINPGHVDCVNGCDEN